MHELEFATIEALAALLAKKKVSPVELTKVYLSRIERLNPKLNAFLTVASESALAEARSAERELLRGRCRGPLHGIPVALKDNIWTRNLRTSMGSSILPRLRASRQTAMPRWFESCTALGAIVLGKTNLHEFAYGVTSDNPHYGPVRNPWATERIPGGSSGGSAAAVAAGLCAAAIGRDTGGSIRIPAALCGVVGLKPTFGRVSVHGVFPLAPSFDHVGPITRSAGDAALVLECIAGRDPLDPTSVARRGEKHFRLMPNRKRPRLGRSKEHFWVDMDPEVRRLTETALRNFVKSDAAVEEISLPTIVAERRGGQPTVAAVEATGRCMNARAISRRAQASEYGADVRARLEQGNADTPAVDYLRARDVVRRARDEVEKRRWRPLDAIVIQRLASNSRAADGERTGSGGRCGKAHTERFRGLESAGQLHRVAGNNHALRAYTKWFAGGAAIRGAAVRRGAADRYRLPFCRKRAGLAAEASAGRLNAPIYPDADGRIAGRSGAAKAKRDSSTVMAADWQRTRRLKMRPLRSE